MTTEPPSFGRPAWREVLRPARHRSFEGWALVGPRGIVAQRLDAALSPWTRVRGLLGRDELGPDEALLLRPCAQVHSVGMRHAFDAVFCDPQLRVLYISTLRPRQFSRYIRGAACCFELAAGRAQVCGLEAGSQLRLAGGS